MGAHCNFGCGSITCNYDGNYKYRTTVGDNAFIGCNTNLVSPCQVGDGAYTAAAPPHRRVPADALAHAGGTGHQTGLGKTASRQEVQTLMLLC